MRDIATLLLATAVATTLASPAGADTARGTVFEDRNGNGRLDAGEPGIEGVRVSDGLDVVTTDADGQYDGAELQTLVTPLLDGRADFVTGSRRLGHHVSDNRVRWLGVRVFAVLASVLTWRHITDTSFGSRAMRAELARSVTLTEPQYQSSELLLGVAARGARVVEVPMTMRLRAHGASKKGANLIYGANYARVMVRTWFREYVRGGRRR